MSTNKKYVIYLLCAIITASYFFDVSTFANEPESSQNFGIEMFCKTILGNTFPHWQTTPIIDAEGLKILLSTAKSLGLKKKTVGELLSKGSGNFLRDAIEFESPKFKKNQYFDSVVGNSHFFVHEIETSVHYARYLSRVKNEEFLLISNYEGISIPVFDGVAIKKGEGPSANVSLKVYSGYKEGLPVLWRAMDELIARTYPEGWMDLRNGQFVAQVGQSKLHMPLPNRLPPGTSKDDRRKADRLYFSFSMFGIGPGTPRPVRLVVDDIFGQLFFGDDLKGQAIIGEVQRRMRNHGHNFESVIFLQPGLVVEIEQNDVHTYSLTD